MSRHRLVLALAGSAIIAYTIFTAFGAHRQTKTAQNILNADFEAGELVGWHKTGNAFDFQPTQGDNPVFRARETSGLHGEWWIGGYERYQGKAGQKPGDIFGDEPTGTLTSDPFTIEAEAIAFLIGGGRHPWNPPDGKNSVCANLIIAGDVVRSSTGVDSETMVWQQWNVEEYRGKTAQIQLVDGHEGGWGHVNFDAVRQSTHWQMESGSYVLFIWTGVLIVLLSLSGRK